MSGNDWVYGLHAVESLLKHHPDAILQLHVLQGRGDERLASVLARAAQRGIPVDQLSRAELDAKTGGVHQGIAALCRELKLEKSEGFLKQLLDGLTHPPFLLVLDGVTDPHNLGACLRSAEAAGVDAVIVPKDKSALMTPTVRKVACGAAELIPFIAVTGSAETTRHLGAGRRRGSDPEHL
jgi:23S rRNA (guanosine2251-2'-O)-methyltransferase